jgi:hypothetical protein
MYVTTPRWLDQRAFALRVVIANSPLIYYCAPRIVMWSSLTIRLYSSVVLPSFAALAT